MANQGLWRLDVQQVIQKTGLPDAVLRLSLCLLAAYPLAFIYRRYLIRKDPTLQHVYFTASGIGIALFCFGPGCIHSMVNVLLAYLLLRLGGPNIVTVMLMFIMNMTYLITGYVSMNALENTPFSWTTTHCILCLRLTGLAWDYFDGAQETISEDFKRTAINKPPSLLQIAGFTYFYGGFLVGPQFSFKRYMIFVEGELTESKKDDPLCISAGLKRFILGLLYSSAFILLDKTFNAKYLITDWFESRNLTVKLFYAAMFGKVVIMKYVAVFLLAEGSCIVSGLSYNGKGEDGEFKWDGTCYVRPWDLETSYCFRHIIDSFNIPTNQWVLRYVYKRLRFLRSKVISSLASMVFLSVWHGVDVGFFIAFLIEFVYMYMEKQAGDLWVMVFHDKGLVDVPLYIGIPAYGASVFFRWVVFSYGLAAFVLLDWQRIQKFFLMTYYFPLSLIPLWILLYPILILPLTKRFAVKDKKDN